MYMTKKWYMKKKKNKISHLYYIIINTEQYWVEEMNYISSNLFTKIICTDMYCTCNNSYEEYILDLCWQLKNLYFRSLLMYPYYIDTIYICIYEWQNVYPNHVFSLIFNCIKICIFTCRIITSIIFICNHSHIMFFM